MHRFVPGIWFLHNDGVVVQPPLFSPLHGLVERKHSVESDSSFADIKRRPVTRQSLIFHILGK